MRKSRETRVHLALVSVVLLSLSLRIGPTPGEAGADTFELHFMAGILRDTGSGGWLLNPLSAFGLFPLSYPSGIPMMAAALSMFAGIGLQESMILLGFLFTTLGTLGMFSLAQRLSRRAHISLAAAAVFALSNTYDIQTTGGVTGRAAISALLPLVVLPLTFRLSEIQYQVGFASARIILFTVFLLTLFACHRLALFVVPLIIVSHITYKALVYGNSRAPPRARTLPLKGAHIAVLTLVAVLWVAFSGISPAPRQGPSFLAPFVFTTDRALYSIGWIVETVWNFGPTLALLPLGVAVAFRRLREPGEQYLFCLVLVEAAVFGAQPPALAYWYFLLPNSILVGFAFVPVLRRIRRAIQSMRWQTPPRRGPLRRGPEVVGLAFVGAILVVTPLIFNQVVTDALYIPNRYPDHTSFYLDPQTEEIGTYLANDGDDAPILTVDVPLGTRLAAISGDATLSSLTSVIGHNSTIMNDAVVHTPFEASAVDLDAWISYLVQYKSLYTIEDPLLPGQSIQTWSHWTAAIQSQNNGKFVRDYYHLAAYAEATNSPLGSQDRFANQIRANAYVEYSNDLVRAYYILRL
jgi:hypothetical protein